LRRLYSERRATGEVVHVEFGQGVVLAIAGWLDSTVCYGMTPGTPRVSVDALAELHRLLAQQVFGEAYPVFTTPSMRLRIKISPNPDLLPAKQPRGTHPRHLCIAFETQVLRGTTPEPRAVAVQALVAVLLQHLEMASKQAEMGLKWGGWTPRSASIDEKQALMSAAELRTVGISADC
jgi:hypothetical protein